MPMEKLMAEKRERGRHAGASDGLASEDRESGIGLNLRQHGVFTNDFDREGAVRRVVAVELGAGNQVVIVRERGTVGVAGDEVAGACPAGGDAGFHHGEVTWKLSLPP